MPKRPRRGQKATDVCYKDVLKVIRILGFKQQSQVGSHMFFSHDDGRATTVTRMNSYGEGLFHLMLRQMGLTRSEFFHILDDR